MKKPPYVIERHTSTQGVFPDLQYFVTADMARYPPQSDVFRRVEQEVEEEYRNKLVYNCRSEQDNKNRKVYQSRWGSAEQQQKANTLSTPSCDDYQEMLTFSRQQKQSRSRRS